MPPRQSLQQKNRTQRGREKCGRQKETPLPRQDVIHDASTSGVARTSRMRCSAGLCRGTKLKSPPTSHPSGGTGSAISQGTRLDVDNLPSRKCLRCIRKFWTCRRDWRAMVGGGSRQSRLLPPVLSPWGTGDRQPSDPSRRTRPRFPRTRCFWCREPKSQNIEGDTCGRKNRSSRRRPRKGKRKKETPSPQASNKHQRQDHNRQKHQRPARRATATSRQSQARQESFVCGPTSLPRGSWDVMPSATQKPGHSFEDLTSPVLVGLLAPRR